MGDRNVCRNLHYNNIYITEIGGKTIIFVYISSNQKCENYIIAHDKKFKKYC